MSQDHHITNEKAIFTLWLNWVISVGALAMPEFLALFIPKSWIPIVTFALMFLIIFYRNSGRKLNTSSCDLIQTISARTLCLSAVVMIIISIIYARGFISLFYPEELLNMRIPYLTILVLGPVAVICCGVAMLEGFNSSVCRQCIIRYGTVSERGFLGNIFKQESRYQMRFLFIISAFLTVVCWTYYALYYVNVNINKADEFIYNWIPTIVYGLSVIFFGMRYFTLWSYYYNHIELNPRVRMDGSGLRFLIVCDNSIYLSRTEGFHDLPDGDKYDTPADLSLSHRQSINVDEASDMLANMSGLEPGAVAVRFMYKSTDLSGRANVFHFICSVPSKDYLAKSSFHGEWITLPELQRLLNNHDLTHMLASEIHRLYTVTMAWKTYDIDGKRLYKIKNYRPAFRLKGICEWNVDFNDPQWLEVSRFNEDKPLFKLRKLLHFGRRRYSSGTSGNA